MTDSLILIICLQADFSLESHNNLRVNTGHLVHCTMTSVLGKVFKKVIPGTSLVVQPFSAGVCGCVPLAGELRSHMPPGQKTKTENRNSIVTNSIKTLKMVHIKKIF